MGNSCGGLLEDKGAHSLATSLLDQVISKAEVDQQNDLYKLTNYRRGGLLADAYKRGGEKELERFALEELPKYMYNRGEGRNITYQEYIQWRHNHNNNNKTEIVINMDTSTPPDKFQERKLCWRLEYRGLLGESLLHVLILCNTEMHNRMGKTLLKLFPSLAMDIIEGDEYFGASPLHFCVAYQNVDLLEMVAESGADVNQRATGKFFMPYDQQRPVPKKLSSFIGLCYMGEYPLAWAACCDDETSYNLLIKFGADPNYKDTFGNMVLHMVVVWDKLKMYGYAWRHPEKPAKDGIMNKNGLTPLTLACKLGRNEIFREMFELNAMEFWRYSNITCSAYALNALDSLLATGKPNWNSALVIILNGKTNEHLDMLDGGIIQRLLEEKWKTFAQRHFLKRLGLTLLHLITLSIAIFLRPRKTEPLFGHTDARSIVRYIAEVITCAGCISIVVFQQVQEIMAQGLQGFLINLVTNPPKLLFVMSSIMILACIPCRVLEDRKTEDVLLAFALPASWFFLIFFAGAIRLTGPFVTMIYSMIVGDMFRFGIIYLIFLLGFSQAFFFVFKNQTELTKRFYSYPQTWMGLFQMTLGAYEYEEFRNTYYKLLTQLVFTIFMVFTPILLLNMLIAMMGNTYCEVIEQSEKEWVRQWAKIIVVLERGISHDVAKEYVQNYSIKLPSPEGAEETEEIRAVMVIRSKAKSKANQRKGALVNWRRLSKKLVSELRANGGSAERVREKYNLHRSSTGPPKNRFFIFEEDEELEPSGPSAEETLGDALQQLAFTHNITITGVNADPVVKPSPTTSPEPTAPSPVPEKGCLKLPPISAPVLPSAPPDIEPPPYNAIGCDNPCFTMADEAPCVRTQEASRECAAPLPPPKKSFLPEISLPPVDGDSKSGCKRCCKKKKKKSKKGLLGKSKVAAADDDPADGREGDDPHEHSICVNVKAKVSSKLAKCTGRQKKKSSKKDEDEASTPEKDDDEEGETKEKKKKKKKGAVSPSKKKVCLKHAKKHSESVCSASDSQDSRQMNGGPPSSSTTIAWKDPVDDSGK